MSLTIKKVFSGEVGFPPNIKTDILCMVIKIQTSAFLEIHNIPNAFLFFLNIVSLLLKVV